MYFKKKHKYCCALQINLSHMQAVYNRTQRETIKLHAYALFD
jgi:hypothetical protein